MQVGDQTKQIVSIQSPRPYVGSFSRDMTLATGSSSVTGLPFRPSAISINCIQNGVGEMHSNGWVGYDTDDTTVKNVCVIKIPNTTWDASGLLGMIYQNAAPLTRYYGSITSFDADGFSIDWIKVGSTTGTMTCYFMAFK